MIPEITLLAVFILSLVILRIKTGSYQFALAGCIGMAAMLVVTGIAHFGFAKGMAMMLPDFIPFRMALVYITGIIEIAFAIGLLISKYRKVTGWLLIVFFILILPANIYAAMHHVNIEKGTLDGDGPDYLWIRIPIQLFFIAWVYFSACRKDKSAVE